MKHLPNWEKLLLIVTSLSLAAIVGFVFIGHVELFPTATATTTHAVYELTQYEDIVYDTEYPNSTLDIIVPASDRQAKLPVIFYVHGGAYIGGDKMSVRAYVTQLAEQGYVIVNLNYGLAPQATYPTPLIQIGQAYRFIESQQAHYPIDLGRVVFAGDSAGAQLALQFANIQVNDQYQQRVGIERSVLPQSIKGVVSLSGLLDMMRFDETSNPKTNQRYSRDAQLYFGVKDWKTTEMAAQASIVGNVDGSFPSLFVTDGNTNSFEDQARDLIAQLKEYGVPTESRFYDEQLGHEFQFDMQKPQSRDAYNALVRFLAIVTKPGHDSINSVGTSSY